VFETRGGDVDLGETRFRRVRERGVPAHTSETIMQSHDEPATAVNAAPKSIILFSDGTGNSSAKLFKTNVWRMYEAVDLGPAAPGKRSQISYYDDGVGTSSFKPLAALGGAFGWGLKRNVLDIYRFACRNYRQGDDIYAFGFSRGAFTARLVVALIASEGLVRSTNEADLERKTLAAYRDFRRHFLPRRLQWPTKLGRRLRSWIIARLDRLRGLDPYDPRQNAPAQIRFIGVWDTVAAYGGPITEITRAVDNWFFPLSMPDYHLHERVLCARHALALDDERDAFQPLLWDEVHEERLKNEERVPPGRLQQVWFTGMHADVGGGYPDESLSYVSLLWMMEEARKAGLRTLDAITDRFVALASSFGPIHNSRAGIAAYYRYQPRKISAWVNPTHTATLSLRDPVIRDKSGRSRGLLQSVNVHESVINRIASGTDRYAPITLPGVFNIIPPQEHGENVPQADSETAAAVQKTGAPKPMLTRELVALVTDTALAQARDAGTETVWNQVWWRRIIYFATLAATLLLLGLPLLLNILPEAPLLTDGRTWIGGVIRLLTIVIPSFAARWVEVYADNPFYFLLFGGVILILLGIGRWMERKLGDQARRVWRRTLDGDAAATPVSRLQEFRTSHGYQRFLRTFKWYFLPDWVITPLTVVVGAWVLFATYVQASLPFLENSDALCQPSPVVGAELTRVSRDFSPREICTESLGWVKQGHRYVVTFDVLDPWYDATLPTSPEGLPAGEFPWGTGYIAGPLKRVVDAHYLQPLIEIRPMDEDGEPGNVRIFPLAVRQVGDEDSLFRADFKARKDGELFLFVNDAMLPFTSALWGAYDFRYFYESSGGDKQAGTHGNRGSACLTIESADVRHPEIAPTPGSVCSKAAERRAAADASLQADLRR
jgi:uncharacterized protein (DUF2235 family)